MEAKLKAGVHLIVDRYSFSGIAYSSVKKVQSALMVFSM